MAVLEESTEVDLTENLPESGLAKEMIRTILEVFLKPGSAYEVEFSGRDGRIIAQATLTPGQVIPSGAGWMQAVSSPAASASCRAVAHAAWVSERLLRLQRNRRHGNAMERRFANLTFKLALGAALSMGPPVMAQPAPVTVPATGAAVVRVAVPPPDPSGTLTFTAENDLFGGNTDRYYSNGVLLSWRSPSADLPPPFAWIDDRLNWLFGPGDLRWGLSLGQNLYTPDDKYRNPPDPRDRPYAGHLYGAFSLSRSTASTQTLFELQAGVVGPSALGEEVQNNYHRLIRVRRLDGWDSQLKDEPTLNAVLERRWRVPLGTLADFDTEVIPSAVAAAGNVSIYAGGGAMLRLGQGLDADWGPTRIRPALAGSSFFQPRQDFGWYVFAGIDARAVGRDLFLDGNTFRNSGPSVNRRPLVGEAQAGAAVFWRGTRLAYTQVIRSEEFYGQRGTQTFGSISASFRF